MTPLNEPPSGGFFYARDAWSVAKWINAHKTSRVPTEEQKREMREAFPGIDEKVFDLWPNVQPLL
jgi:hypothetical protein